MTQFQVKNTLLTGKRCHRDKVLCKAISGVLQSQGFCVIIGSDTLYVSRVRFTPLYLQAPTFVFLGFQLLHTLALFVPDELRWCCLRMYRHKFSPYVRLQVVHRVREILALRLRPILRRRQEFFCHRCLRHFHQSVCFAVRVAVRHAMRCAVQLAHMCG